MPIDDEYSQSWISRRDCVRRLLMVESLSLSIENGRLVPAPADERGKEPGPYGRLNSGKIPAEILIHLDPAGRCDEEDIKPL